MAYETIQFETAGRRRITLNRPDRLNSFTAQCTRSCAMRSRTSATARVVVLTGAGRGFCAGQDLNDRAVAPGETVDLGETVEKSWNPLIRTLTSLPQPVIARVNGVAAGAGANIALACDIVVAAKSAKFIQSFSAIGLIPDSGGTWVLPRLVGQARALGPALTGEPLPAEKAAEWGLIWKAVDDDALDAEVDAIADKLATLPPLGLAAIKDMIRVVLAIQPRRRARAPGWRNAATRLHRGLPGRRRGLPREAAAKVHRTLSLQLSSGLTVTPAE